MLQDIKTYVGFTDRDTQLLREFKPFVAPEFPNIAEHFYDCILRHPNAHAAITGGSEQVERLKRTLVDWMDSGLSGPHDTTWYERRARIGRVHVKIGLPQHYMFTAMNVMRLDFRRLLEATYAHQPTLQREVGDALDRVFDIELCIMLQTYREDSEDRLRRRERLATIGQLAAGIGHDMRNPLGVIRSSLYILQKHGPLTERMERHLDRISTQVDICASIVTDLLEMARNRPSRREPIDLAKLFDDVLGATRPPDSIHTTLEIEPQLDLRGEFGLLRQAIINLVTNAVSALEGRAGSICIRAKLAKPDTIEISVADDGPGFDSDMLAVAFEPLVTSRQKGTGLGLALVKSVAERHGGSAVAANPPGGGACVRLLLPAGDLVLSGGGP